MIQKTIFLLTVMTPQTRAAAASQLPKSLVDPPPTTMMAPQQLSGHDLMNEKTAASSGFCFFFYFFARVFGFLNGFFFRFFDVLVFHRSSLAFRQKKLREKHVCFFFRESHGFAFASSERKKMHFLLFSFPKSHGFASARGTDVFSRESRPCLSKTKKMCFLFFFFRNKHGFASMRVTAVPFVNEKRTRFLFSFSFARVTVLLSREVRLCFRESHGRASRKQKKCIFYFFSFRDSHDFASTKGKVVLSRESRPCLLGNEKKHVFSFFFFRKGHGFVSARGTVVIMRGTGVPFLEREKIRAPDSVFS